MLQMLHSPQADATLLPLLKLGALTALMLLPSTAEPRVALLLRLSSELMRPWTEMLAVLMLSPAAAVPLVLRLPTALM